MDKTYFHDNDSFLNHIADSRSNELEKNVDATFSSRLDLDRRLTDSFDTLPHEINIHLGSVPRTKGI